MDYIKSKPTDVFGVQFRSRLEARWAMFFQLLQIPWLYEPAKFEYGNHVYIPDFCIAPKSTLDDVIWLEIKPWLEKAKEPKLKYKEFSRLVVEQLADTFYFILYGPPSEYFCLSPTQPCNAFYPFNNFNEIEIACAASNSTSEDIGVYETITNRAHRVLKQKTGFVTLRRVTQQLERYVRDMPGCWEAQDLLALCKKKLSTRNIPSGQEYVKVFENKSTTATPPHPIVQRMLNH